MPEPSDPPRTLTSRPSTGDGLPLALILTSLYLALAALSAFLLPADPSWVRPLAAILLLALAPIAFMLTLLSARLKGTGAMLARLNELRSTTLDLADRAALSDTARRALSRHAERDILVEAIEADLAAQDWDSALAQIAVLGDTLGARTLAETYRQRIHDARSGAVDAALDAELAEFERRLSLRHWQAAHERAARLARLYPDSPRVVGLMERLTRAQTLYKVDVERRFLIASREDRPDEALELLKELDQYLTEVEAEPYRELARGIISKAREHLGADFKLAVQDRHWERAVVLGERIIAEFPNSRMAAEVREMIDQLRARRAGQSQPTFNQ